MIETGQKGCLIVVSGPSGSGKSTIIQRMMECYGDYLPPLYFSVSATTRAPRAGELDGVAYHFLSGVAFGALRDSGGLLEWAEYAGNCYGTPREPIERALAEGKVAVLDIEGRGAEQVQASFPEAVLVCILPQSLSELRLRLQQRGTDSEETIERRMKTVGEQLEYLHLYQHLVFNQPGQADRAAFELAAIVATQFTGCQQRKTMIEE